jgi:2-hydroxy-3-oxopropionate reductase
MSNVGFIGLGIMGKPMAAQSDQGRPHALPELPQRRAEGADRRRRQGLRDSAEGSRANGQTSSSLMLPDTPDVEKVLFGAGGRCERSCPGQDRCRHELDLADRDQGLRKKSTPRLRLPRCPVSGGEVGAKNAALTIMVGAPQAAFDRVKPLFDLMGKNITLVGGNGDGQTCKVCNQIIVALNIEAVGEALLFASKGRRRSGESAAGTDGRLRRLAHPRSARRTHDQAHIRSGVPDRIASEGPESRPAGARAMGMSLPNTATAQELFNACTAHGGAKWDHSAMVRALEKMANHEVA